VIVIVLSVTPEKLRGEITRWLLEISTGVYVGHLSARVRENLWERIVSDVARGRAIMVWSTRNEQRLAFRVHNHSWTVEDFDGISLMRRVTSESRELARAKNERRSRRSATSTQFAATSAPERTGNVSLNFTGLDAEEQDVLPKRQSQSWSYAGRRRRYRNAVEQRHAAPRKPQPNDDAESR